MQSPKTPPAARHGIGAERRTLNSTCTMENECASKNVQRAAGEQGTHTPGTGRRTADHPPGRERRHHPNPPSASTSKNGKKDQPKRRHGPDGKQARHRRGRPRKHHAHGTKNTPTVPSGHSPTPTAPEKGVVHRDCTKQLRRATPHWATHSRKPRQRDKTGTPARQAVQDAAARIAIRPYLPPRLPLPGRW